MWLSKRIVQETPEFEPATLGTVSIGGEDAAVVHLLAYLLSPHMVHNY